MSPLNRKALAMIVSTSTDKDLETGVSNNPPKYRNRRAPRDSSNDLYFEKI